MLYTPELMVQSLLSNDKKPDIYDLGVADGIKEMLAVHGFTKDKILNTTVSNLAETLHIDYYVVLSSITLQEKYRFTKLLSDLNIQYTSKRYLYLYYIMISE